MRGPKTILLACFVVLLLVLLAGAARSDDFVGLTWDTALPAGDLKDYIGEFSLRGFTFEGRHFFRQNWSVGGSLNYNVFHENTDELISIDSRDISGTQFRVVYSLPLLATVHYYINWDYYQKVEPYVGLGVGAYRMERRLDIGVYSIRDKNWHFGLAPEFGIGIPFDYTKSVYFNVKYNYAFEAGGIGPYTYWGFNLGAAWRQ
jgi:opacity protein-like surface antigen